MLLPLRLLFTTLIFFGFQRAEFASNGSNFAAVEVMADELDDLIAASSNWTLNIPVVDDGETFCYDYWGRAHARHVNGCVYFFHSEIFFNSGASAEHYIHYNQDIAELQDKIRLEEWDASSLVEKCIKVWEICHARAWIAASFHVNSNSISYFTTMCCVPPGCYRPAINQQEALFYPQSIYGYNVIKFQEDSLIVDTCFGQEPLERAKIYYLGSMKPLASGVDEDVFIKFGQDSDTCSFGTPGNGSIQIGECDYALRSINENYEKCFIVCLHKAFDFEGQPGGLWAADELIVEMLTSAQLRRESHCVAYSDHNGGCVITRDPADAAFIANQHYISTPELFYSSTVQIEDHDYDFECFLSTQNPPIIYCQCHVREGQNNSFHCDAYMYGREQMFNNMYDGKWDQVITDNATNFSVMKPSCPSADGRMVLLCEIVFIYNNGVLTNKTAPVNIERLKVLRELNFLREYPLGVGNETYFCAEEMRNDLMTIVCVCSVEYAPLAMVACTSSGDFSDAKNEAVKNGGRSVEDLSQFGDELRKCLRQHPEDRDREEVVDYQADFLCFYIQRSASTGVQRLMDWGIYSKTSPLPQFPILRVLCDRQRIISTRMIMRGCLCGYYFHTKNYRFLVCCCLPQAIETELARAAKSNIV